MADDGGHAVEAELNYLGPVTGTPTTWTYEPPPGVERLFPRDCRVVRIADGRALEARPTLGREGFELVEHPGGIIDDFRDEAAVRERHYPAVAELVRALVGAAEVVVFDHTYRSSERFRAGEQDRNAPVHEIHGDYTERSGPDRARQVCGERHADALAAGRYAIFNVWRPINGVVEQHPLAICDASSMEADDFVPAEVKFADRTGHVMVARYRPAHRWIYFPAMSPAEAVVFATYDPRATGAARYSAHSAFADPTSPNQARVRESIELRTVAVFA